MAERRIIKKVVHETKTKLLSSDYLLKLVI